MRTNILKSYFLDYKFELPSICHNQSITKKVVKGNVHIKCTNIEKSTNRCASTDITLIISPVVNFFFAPFDIRSA